MSNTKQIIIMRADLKMRKGKIASQAAHASMAFLTRGADIDCTADGRFHFLQHVQQEHAEVIKKWMESSFAKICVYVNSEQELLDIYNKAKEKGMICSLITDNGKTEFNNVPTITCCAIGPDYNESFVGVTDQLPLY